MTEKIKIEIDEITITEADAQTGIYLTCKKTNKRIFLTQTVLRNIIDLGNDKTLDCLLDYMYGRV